MSKIVINFNTVRKGDKDEISVIAYELPTSVKPELIEKAMKASLIQYQSDRKKLVEQGEAAMKKFKEDRKDRLKGLKSAKVEQTPEGPGTEIPPGSPDLGSSQNSIGQGVTTPAVIEKAAAETKKSSAAKDADPVQAPKTPAATASTGKKLKPKKS